MLNDSTDSGDDFTFQFQHSDKVAHVQRSTLASAVVHGIDQSVAAEGLAKIKYTTEIFK